MPAGKLDQTIELQSATSYTKSALGADVPEWETYAEVKAEVILAHSAGAGAERFKGPADVSERWALVRIRRILGVKADHRILWYPQLDGSEDPTILDIRSVEPDGQRKLYIVLRCRVVK